MEIVGRLLVWNQNEQKRPAGKNFFDSKYVGWMPLIKNDDLRLEKQDLKTKPMLISGQRFVDLYRNSTTFYLVKGHASNVEKNRYN